LADIPARTVAEEACQAVLQFDRRPGKPSLRTVSFFDINQTATDELVIAMRHHFGSGLPSADRSHAMATQDVRVSNWNGISAQSSVQPSYYTGAASKKSSSVGPTADDNNAKTQWYVPDEQQTRHQSAFGGQVKFVVTKPEDKHGSASDDGSGDNVCSICLDRLKSSVKSLTCGHTFHPACIDKQFIYQPKCPCCGKIFGQLKGEVLNNQNMSVSNTRDSLDGYPGCGTIVINYTIPDGIQSVNIMLAVFKYFEKLHIEIRLLLIMIYTVR
jgi:Zinc finger, C3HC4 type (RING finger)